jgi:hypothetical protein
MSNTLQSTTTPMALAEAHAVLSSLGATNFRHDLATVECGTPEAAEDLVHRARLRLREGYVEKVRYSPDNPKDTRVFILFSTPRALMARMQ